MSFDKKADRIELKQEAMQLAVLTCHPCAHPQPQPQPTSEQEDITADPPRRFSCRCKVKLSPGQCSYGNTDREGIEVSLEKTGANKKEAKAAAATAVLEQVCGSTATHVYDVQRKSSGESSLISCSFITVL